jgi:hypothetical protein
MDITELESFLEDLGDAVQELAIPVAEAAAQVIYERMQLNVARIPQMAGNLAASIYVADASDAGKEGWATYHISWDSKAAPHGSLLEYGYWQRYAVRYTSQGWVTQVRPEMQGKPEPGPYASQAQKDAYYLPRVGGPVYIAGKAFARGALSAAEEACDAAQSVLLSHITEIR